MSRRENRVSIRISFECSQECHLLVVVLYHKKLRFNQLIYYGRNKKIRQMLKVIRKQQKCKFVVPLISYMKKQSRLTATLSVRKTIAEG